jgi:hypothetical protein
MTRLAMLAWAAVTLAGCVAVQEAAIKQNLVQSRFFARQVQRPLSDIDRVLSDRRRGTVDSWCELCVISIKDVAQGREYCLSSHDESSCLVAQQTPGGG